MDAETHITLCTQCSESYPSFLFEFGIPYRCGCGRLVGPPTPEILPTEPDSDSGLRDEENRRARELQRRAERICYLIASTDTPRKEIELEMKDLRTRCGRYFPEMRGAYERIYEARFQKLWREFRTP